MSEISDESGQAENCAGILKALAEDNPEEVEAILRQTVPENVDLKKCLEVKRGKL